MKPFILLFVMLGCTACAPPLPKYPYYSSTTAYYPPDGTFAHRQMTLTYDALHNLGAK